MTAPRVLVLNAGSSTLKASVLAPPDRDPLARTVAEWMPGSEATAERADVLRGVLDELGRHGAPATSIGAVGHRVVHGGTRFVEPTLIDDTVVEAIEELSVLAPLHNPVAAETIRAARAVLPDVPHVAAFDTAVHAALPPTAFRYAVPARWFGEWGIRRYGFHGLSVAWSALRAAELLDRPATELRLVVAHLGAGCSVTATDGGRSVDTSMGYTPLEGLVMATRSGSIDPGILLRLLADGRLTVEELGEDLEHRSGLLGVSGRSGDVRELLAAESAGDEASALALALFAHRAAAGIAAAASALPHLDALVFTGGIGEHAGSVRARIVERLAVLGIAPVATDGGEADGLLSAPGQLPAVLRIEAREDVVVAEAVAGLVGAAAIAPAR